MFEEGLDIDRSLFAADYNFERNMDWVSYFDPNYMYRGCDRYPKCRI